MACLMCQSAYADLTANVGLGKAAFGPPHIPFERTLSLGYQQDSQSGAFLRLEIGWFLDISGHGKSSFWVAPLLGISSQTSTGFELHLAIGPGYLQNPDERLGGHFQFSLEGGGGILSHDTYVGVAWKHLSSAGLEMPNMGRDFVVTQFRLRGI